MPRNDSMSGKGLSRVREQGQKYDYTSLEEYYKMARDLEMMNSNRALVVDKNNIKKIKALQQEVDKNLQAMQLQRQIAALKKLAELEVNLAKHNMQMTSAQRKRYIEDIQRTQANEEKKSLIEYWKTFSRQSINQRQREDKQLEKDYAHYSRIFELRGRLLQVEEFEAAEKRVAEAMAEVNEAGNEAAKQLAEKNLAQARKDLAVAQENFNKVKKQLEEEKKAKDEEKSKKPAKEPKTEKKSGTDKPKEEPKKEKKSEPKKPVEKTTDGKPDKAPKKEKKKETPKKDTTTKPKKKKEKPSSETKETKETIKALLGKLEFAKDFVDNFETGTKILNAINKEKDLGAGGRLAEQLDKSIGAMVKAFNEGMNEINEAIDTYAGYKMGIDARLQGAVSVVDGNKEDTDFEFLEDKLNSVAFSPLIRTETLYANLSELVAEGISANVAQVAFLQTVKDGIATTFEVNNSALRRIIRLQQYDSTAARLGMEASLTAYLNELVSSTEYLQQTFDSVAEGLLEASSTMSAQQSAEFEYVVQKWLGTLSGLGLSDSAASSIAQAIGHLGSGDITNLSSSAIQNLIAVSSSGGGASFSDLLTRGLDAGRVNDLLYNMLTYVSNNIATTNNNVVRSELAKTFGLSVSDVISIQNLFQSKDAQSTINNLYNNVMSFTDMYSELTSQMNDLSGRVGIANIIQNANKNFLFSTGMSIGASPILNTTWQVTDLIQKYTGGINLPFISAMGNGLDLNATAEGLIKLGIVGISTLGNIGGIVSGIGSILPDGGTRMLKNLGIGATEASNVIARGSGFNSNASGSFTTSISTMVGNSNGDDYYDSSVNNAKDDQKEDIDKANQDAKEDDPTLKIYEMLDDADIKGMQHSILEELKSTVIELKKITETIDGDNNIKVNVRDMPTIQVSGLTT
jgi:hypothetical protein